MKIKILLTACFVSLLSVVQAQEAGYFGKKTFVDLSVQGQLPIIYSLVNRDKGYVMKSGKLQKSYNLKDFGFRGSLGYMFSENAGLAFEYNHHLYQVNPLRGGELNRQYVDSATGALTTEYIQPQVAFLDIQERTFMLKSVFSSFNGRVPAGLTHEWGVGYCMIGIDNREAAASNGTDSVLTGESISKNLIDADVDEYKGMVFMYGLRMNYPLNKSMLFHIGVRYSYSWLFDKKDFRKTEQTEAWLSGRELWSRINQRRQLGIINLGAGLTICF
ncbi:MAG: hypothetical protein A3D31_17695 [Candidatus Fluviicola riflensis]|nr:MAG: hypothetical protein CHH17_02635 [Candidatus Fluviicola riflensis]OGS76817.1 MAG: hypothetical protein A3D31_17695 [Candidatus Fluviicola riflensis]OGS82828.1 MAG: hypothetical protein A2724_13665 [Fluviicola sp. RIFCSPHIGHO2_01_FULL_43_53]OGS88547.1 MAG: hypothetical protein A3E30_07200 [Fluviicola sp. RIFCSPHIGHO2_12_FULL_43_24]